MGKILGEFEVLILLAIVRLKKAAYGATIHREIEVRVGRTVAIGAIYTGLARLQRNGYVKSRIGEPTPERGGRRKKFYEIRPAGAVALTRSVQAHRRMTEGIEKDLETLISVAGSR